MELKGKRVLVVGLGLQGGGLATVKWLVRQGARVTITDLKTRSQLAASLRQLRHWPIKYHLGSHPLSLLKGQDLLVQNPAVPRESPLIKAADKFGLPIENEASIFFKLCPAPIMAVTGSKGKSTTATWLGKIFKLMNPRTVVAGNIKDELMLAVLPKIRRSTPVILELSSWQLEVMARWRLAPHLAIVTNILPDHLDRYASFESYTTAKSYIFRFQKKGDAVVLNWDNKASRVLVKSLKNRPYWFSLKERLREGGFVDKKVAWFKSGKRVVKLFNLNDLRVPGEHNLANALAAATAAAVANVPASVIRRAVRGFTGLHSRLESVGTYRGVEYINDTTATVPDAVIAAIKALREKSITLIAGGKDKNLDYAELSKYIKKSVKHLVLFPGSATAKLLKSLSTSYHYSLVSTMIQAVKITSRITAKGGVVLLSPAATSFGLFLNEWDRGSQFVKAVRALK